MTRPTLLVLAAGMGSRYGGLKQMAGVGPQGETLLEYAVHDAVEAGFAKVVFVIRPDFAEAFRETVVARVEDKIPVELAFQVTTELPAGCVAPPNRTKPWGTGHAVWSARRVVREPFAVINADDYYGPSAYRQAAAFISASNSGARPWPFGLVAFSLGRTLSAHGTVSRGICAVDASGFLRGVQEVTGIQTLEGKLTADQDLELSPETPASMNFFVFTPDIFAALEAQLIAFFSRHGGEAKSEFYLPASVGLMIDRGEATVAVMRSEDPWMGVTYAEDRPDVVAQLAALHRAGVYPERLG